MSSLPLLIFLSFCSFSLSSYSVSFLSPSLCNSRSLIHFIDINSVGILYSVSRWNRNNLKQITGRGESIVFIQNFVAWRFFQKIWLCEERMMSISSEKRERQRERERERERWITFRTMTPDSSPLSVLPLLWPHSFLCHSFPSHYSPHFLTFHWNVNLLPSIDGFSKEKKMIGREETTKMMERNEGRDRKIAFRY